MLWKVFRDARGSVAVEMAIVGPLFIVMMLTMIEVALTLLSQSVLNAATQDAARLVRTRQIVSAGDIGAFQQKLCADLSAVLINATCDGNVVFDVEPFSRAGAMFAHDPPCTRNANAGGSGVACPFDVGGGGQIVGVQVRYWRPFLVPWVGGCLSGGSCWFGGAPAQGSSPGVGGVLQTSVAVFRDE
jgi:Flp pilus assembly protein TadG